MKPRLLDLFCGAGGCSRGYQEAGFYVVGVDINPQPRYIGDEFYQGDALEFCAEHGHEFDIIHASPPCQLYGKSRFLASKDHPKLIENTRAVLIETGQPYVIENVPGAPLINPTILNGPFFELPLARTRLFETYPQLPFMLIPPENKPVKMGRAVTKGDVIQPVGNFSGVDYARRIMGIDWMTRDEIAQAIPPAYACWIGLQMMDMVFERKPA